MSYVCCEVGKAQEDIIILFQISWRTYPISLDSILPYIVSSLE